MTCNMGTADRIIRVVLGITLIGLGVFMTGTLGIVLGFIGLIPLITGIVGNCPIYSMFKVNTCKTHISTGMNL